MPHPHPLLPQHLLYLLILNHLLPVILPSSSTGFLIPVFFFEHPVPVISIATILPVKTKTFPHFFISNTSLFNITNQLLSVYRISIFVNYRFEINCFMCKVCWNKTISHFNSLFDTLINLSCKSAEYFIDIVF